MKINYSDMVLCGVHLKSLFFFPSYIFLLVISLLFLFMEKSCTLSDKIGIVIT